MNSETMTGRKYNLNPDILNDIKNSIDWAEEKRLIEGEKRGIIKGREEGKQEGLIEGEKKGIIRGRKEGRKEEKLSLARNLLLKDMEIDIIREITGLSLEEISKLQDEL